MSVSVELRPASAADEPFLWVMLFEASHAGEDGLGGPDDLRAVPELARYVAGWGRPGDLGVIAVDAGGRRPARDRDGDGSAVPVGAAWVRLLTRSGGGSAGYGWVDDATPELVIATDPSRRGAGVGAVMLERLLADVRAASMPGVSLSVRSDNPARRLYDRFGFRALDGFEITNRTGSTSLTMALHWA